MAKIVNEVTELIQAADAAQATVAAVKAYIANDPNARHKHQEEGNAYDTFKAMSDKEFLRNVVQDKRGNVVFKGVDPDLYDEALLRWCQLNKIPCSKELSEKLCGVLGQFQYKLPAEMITNPQTMNMLGKLANVDDGFGGSRNFFFYMSEKLNASQINAICASAKGSADAGRKLCDAIFGQMQDGREIHPGETLIRMACGQIKQGFDRCTAFDGTLRLVDGTAVVTRRVYGMN